MPIPRTFINALCAILIVLNADLALSQDYPNKTIRIVTSGVGGSNDLGARVLAAGLSGTFAQVIVDNRPSVTIAAEIVAGAPPDGYALIFSGSPLWIGPLIEKLSYDPVKDFAPISLVVSAPNILVMHPSLPIKSVKDLIALAKSRPGELNCASGSIGSSPHLALELFKALAGVNIVGIGYKSSGPAINSLIGGEIQLMFATAGSIAPHVKSGRLKALAVTSAQPSVLAPGLPTVSSSGLPGYESASPNGLFAPAKTPASVINRLHQEIVRVLSAAQVKERFLNAGVETVGSSPAEFAATIKSEMARLGKVIREAGVKAQ